MKRGKFEAQPVAKKNSGKKLVSLLLVLVLLLGTVIGTTLAWLTATSNTVKNTFTFGNISISLAETKGTAVGGDEDNRTFKLTPGAKVAKDPKVTVEADSEACWLFVKVEAKNNSVGSVSKILSWTKNGAWTELGDGVYYIQQEALTGDGATAVSYYVFAGEGDGDNQNGYVTVSGDLTAENIETINGQTDKPTIEITAYAIQSSDLTKDGSPVTTAAEAWALINAG